MRTRYKEPISKKTNTPEEQIILSEKLTKHPAKNHPALMQHRPEMKETSFSRKAFA